jgi:hypothetical protein
MKKHIIGVAVAVFFVASCSSSDEMEVSTDDTVVVDDSVEDVSDDAGAEGVAEFVVTVGENSGSDQVFTVAAGSEVRLIFVNPAEDDEFHLHGYDLGGAMTPEGEEAIMRFVASEVGQFEVESHMTGEVLMVLVVE